MPSSTLSPLLSLSSVAAIAHRGGSRLRPENTMSAFAHAASLGVDAIECDVHLSRDDELMVIHDPTLERTTDGRGPVSACTARELAELDAAYHFTDADGGSFRGAGVTIPTLPAVLRQFPGMPFIVEIKGADIRAAGRVWDVIREAGAESRVIVGGFSLGVLQAIRERAGHLVTSASSREVQAALRRAWIWMGPGRHRYQLFQVPVQLKGRPVLTQGFVRAARRAGVPVQAWIVDDPNQMRRLIGWGVTGLISDRPDLAVAVARTANRTTADR
ncbi:MAG: glycerophosphodiester phosphodiesterase [Vicinamibacterales bacterium]